MEPPHLFTARDERMIRLLLHLSASERPQFAAALDELIEHLPSRARAAIDEARDETAARDSIARLKQRVAIEVEALYLRHASTADAGVAKEFGRLASAMYGAPPTAAAVN